MSSASALEAFSAVCARDLRLIWRRRGDAAQPVLFALIVITLVPLALGPEPETLQGIAPGVVWVAVLLAGMLSLDTLFRTRKWVAFGGTFCSFMVLTLLFLEPMPPFAVE